MTTKTKSKSAAAEPANSKKAATKSTTRPAAKRAPAARPAPAAKKAAATKKAAKAASAKPAAKKTAAAKPATGAAAAKKTASKKPATAKAAPTRKPASKSAPAKKAAETKATPTKPAAKKPAAPKAAASAETKPEARPAAPAVGEKKTPAKPANDASPFKVKDFVVYPSHGVGVITGIEKQTIAGLEIELYVVDFEQEKMTLRVPTAKAKSGGMRALSDPKRVDDAVATLQGRARVKRTMWSRRAQEYEAKINSGDLISIAEVVRDLFRAEDQPEQSYSERQLFESALDRMAREVAAVRGVDASAAIAAIEESLSKRAAA